MRKKYGGGGGDSGSALWEAVVAVLMVLVAAVAFAEQANHGQGQDSGKPKRIIEGRHEDQRAVERLLDESVGDAKVEVSEKTVINLKGRFPIDKSKPVEDAALDFIDRHRNAFGLKDPKGELKLIRKSSTLRFQQTYNGVPIWGKEMIVHVNKDRELDDVSSDHVPTPDIDTTPRITADEAERYAKDYCESRFPNSNPQTYHRKFPTELVIDNNLLVYIVTMFPATKWWEIHVDAKTGKIINLIDRTRYFTPEDLPTNGVDGGGSITPIRVYDYNNTYYFAHSFPNITGTAVSSSWFKENDGTPPALDDKATFDNLDQHTICAFDAHTSVVSFTHYDKITFFGTGLYSPDAVVNSAGDRLTSGVNVLHNHDEIFRYFMNKFPSDFRNWDDSLRGVTYAAAIDEDNNYSLNRAFWNGPFIQYGPGDNQTRADTTIDLDIAAHEFGHALTFNKIGNLNPKGQSGSIDENISDVWAIMVDTDDYIIGDKSFSKYGQFAGRRNFASPDDTTMWNNVAAFNAASRPLPVRMSDFLYTSVDNFGRHQNLGILDKAAYNLIQALGGDVTGREWVAKLYYRAYDYLKSGSLFYDLRDALKKAATDTDDTHPVALDPSAVGPIFSSFSSVGIKRGLPRTEDIQYDNCTDPGTAASVGLDGGAYGALFIPYYRGTLVGVKALFTSDDTTPKLVKLSVIPTDGDGNVSATALFSQAAAVENLNKLSLLDLYSPDKPILVNGPFFIKVEPQDTGVSLGYTFGKNPSCNVYKANTDFTVNATTGNYNFNDDHYVIRPIIVYNDTTPPTSAINPITDCSKTENGVAYYNQKYFEAHPSATVTITGSSNDNDGAGVPDDQKGSGVKKVMVSFQGYSTATHYASGANPFCNYSTPATDKTDDATWHDWEYKWGFKDQDGTALPDGYYKITAKATDMKNNPEAAHTETPARNVMEVVLDRAMPMQLNDLTLENYTTGFELNWEYSFANVWNDQAYMNRMESKFDHYNVYRSEEPFYDVTNMQPVDVSYDLSVLGDSSWVDDLTDFGWTLFRDFPQNFVPYKSYYYAVTMVDKAGNENKKVVPTSGTAGHVGLYAEYFSENICNSTCSGTPSFTNLVATEYCVDTGYGDAYMCSDTNKYSGEYTCLPGGVIPSFSVRWTGVMKIESPGNYSFKTSNVISGVRMWVNDTEIINNWAINSGNNTGTIHLDAGLARIKIEYYACCSPGSLGITWTANTGDGWHSLVGLLPPDFHDDVAQQSFVTAPKDGDILTGISTCTVSGLVNGEVGSYSSSSWQSVIMGFRTKQVDVSTGDPAVWTSASYSPPNLYNAVNWGYGTWTYTWTLPTADGKYTIKSRTTDTAGNVENPGPGVTVIVDNHPPASAISTPSSGASFPPGLITVTGTATDGQGSGVAKVEVQVNNGNWQLATDTSTDKSWSTWSLPVNLRGASSFTIKSKATDKVTPQPFIEIPGTGITVSVIDLAPPPPPVITPSLNGLVTINAFFDVSGTASDDGSGVEKVEVSIDGGKTWNTAMGTDNWSLPVLLPNTGDFTIQTKATDYSGNVSTSTSSITVSRAINTSETFDSINAPVSISNLPFVNTANTSTATSSANDPSAYSPYGHSVWYSYMPTTSDDVYLDTSGSSYNTVIGVYDVSSGAFRQVAGNSYECGATPPSNLIFSAKAGTSYLIMVGSKGTDSGGSLVLTVNSYNPPANGPVWTRQDGTNLEDDAYSVATDGNGNVYVAGQTLGAFPCNTSAGSLDVFVSKYDNNGGKVWTRQMGTTSTDWASGVSADKSGNVYVVGATYGGLDGNTNVGGVNLFVTKYDTTGNKAWTKQTGTGYGDWANGVYADDAHGLIYVTGATGGSLPGNTNTGGTDAFVAQYSVNGTPGWIRQLGSAHYAEATGISGDADGNVYVVGRTLGGRFDGNSPMGMWDGFLVKFDSTGVKKWSVQLGTSEDDEVSGVTVDKNGYIYITGSTTGSFAGYTNLGNPGDGTDDVFVAKYDTDSNMLWIRQTGTADEDWPSSISLDSKGHIYVTGYTNGNLDGNINAGNSDVFVMMYDSDGNKLWSRQMGTAVDDEAYGVSVDNNDNIFVAGYTNGGLDGNVNAGGYDYFVSKFAPPHILAPTSTITSPDGTAPIKGSTYIIIGTAADAGSGVQYVDVSIDNGEWQRANGTTNWNITWNSPADGSHTIQSRATSNSNIVESTTIPTVTVTVDNTPPVVYAGPDKTTNAQFTQTATATDANPMTYSWSMISGPGTVTFAPLDSLSTTVSANADGIYTLRFTATDSAGNSSYSDMKLAWDSTAPTSSICSLAQNDTLTGTTYTITGTADDGVYGSGVQKVEVSTDGGNTWHGATGTSSWSYNWTLPPSGGSRTIRSRATDNAGNVEPPGAGVRVTVTSYSFGNPELPHFNWNAAMIPNGTDCTFCHATPNKFLAADFRKNPGFCYSCHNAAGVGHALSIYSSQGQHIMFGNATATGRRKPTYGNITAGEGNDIPSSRLKDGYKVTCITCHNPMKKSDDPGRVWEGTSTSDRYKYRLQNGGWSVYGNMVPKVYRDSATWGTGGPAYSKTKKSYLVNPSEYAYNEMSGLIRFKAQQASTSHIYVTLYFPYLRAPMQDNSLCLDCHTEATHKEANCLNCHQAHNTKNLKGVREKVRASNFTTVAVKFLSYTGANSFADGNSTYDGICEVCHTQTKYYKRDGSGFANHSGGYNYKGKNCEVCHQHKKGFSKYMSVSDGQLSGAGAAPQSLSTGGGMALPDGGGLFMPNALDNFSM